MNLFLDIIVTTVFRHISRKKLDTIAFEKWQGINPMGLSAPWVELKNKQSFTNMRMSPTKL